MTMLRKSKPFLLPPASSPSRWFCDVLMRQSPQSTWNTSPWRPSSVWSRISSSTNRAPHRLVRRQTGTMTPRSADQVPGPRSLAGEYDPQRYMEMALALHRHYGSIVRMEDENGMPSYMLFDPEDIRKVLQSASRTPDKSPLPGLFHYREQRAIGQGIFGSVGEEWHRLRRQANANLLRPLAVNKYAQHQYVVSRDLVELIRMLRDGQNEVTDSLSVLNRWAAELSCSVMFNERIGALREVQLQEDSRPERLIHAVNEMFDTIHILAFQPTAASASTKRRFADAMDYLCRFIEEHVDSCMKRTRSTGSDDLLGVLPAILSNGELSRDDVIVLMSDLFFASIDTVSHTMAFAIYQLARNPAKQEILADEISQVAPTGYDITPEVLKTLRYLKAVLKESQRLMPVFGMITRNLEKELVLSGYRMPVGTKVTPFHYVPSRLPEYFHEPDRFMPERWLRNSVKTIPQFSSLPFGHGARGCVGKRMAEQGLQLALLQIVQRFRVEYHNEDVRLMSRLINTPDKPLTFTFSDRV